MTDDITGHLYGGSSLTPLSNDDGALTCRHHRLHLPFLRCGQPAAYRFTKAHGEQVDLCAQHASELHARYARLDSAWGTKLDDGLDIGWRNDTPIEDDDDISVAMPSFTLGTEPAPQQETLSEAPDLFAGGESGGAGAGASFGDDLPAEAAPEEVSGSRDAGVNDAIQDTPSDTSADTGSGTSE